MVNIYNLYKVFVKIDRVTIICGWKQGIYTYAHSDGKPWHEWNYKNNILHGKSREWDKNDHVRYVDNYLNGKCHGKSYTWYPNDKLQNESNYKNGLRHGLNRSWDENGKLKRKRKYKNGELICEINYRLNSDGKLIKI